MRPIPFQTIDWTSISRTTLPGETGQVHSQTVQYPGLRIRIIEYGPGYLADHWCTKGHVVHCLEGEFSTELKNGDRYKFCKGMSYIVSDEQSIHRSRTNEGVKLLIIDGDFLK